MIYDFSLKARTLLALFLVFITWDDARADGPAIQVVPDRVSLIGPEAVQQLAVQFRPERGDPIDTTPEAAFVSSDPAIASVRPDGMIVAKGDGTTRVTIQVRGQIVDVPVVVSQVTQPPPIHFAHQVVPLFTKLGCNSGGCHGKASGQNGFRLSLLGFEPLLDYETLVLEARGRRLFPPAPERSLLLTKATAGEPHGGGRKLERDSHEYRLIARWIAAGMPLGPSDAPTLSKITIWPEARVLGPGGEGLQLIVTAHYSDDSTEDVTRRAQYLANDPEVLNVTDSGRVATRELAGQVAVMARYQGLVAVSRVTVPLATGALGTSEFTPHNFVDELAAQQWRALGLSPSPPCTDAEFIRRASLDITGTLPTAEETRAFVADTAPEKRSNLIDRLLDRPEYGDFFAVKWGDLLRNKRENNAGLQRGTYRLHDWLRAQIAANVPYDQLVRKVLTATGTAETTPPVVWYRRLRTPDAFVDDTAQVFMGMRVQCAKCHHHPFEVWSQDDYYGLAAFFARIGRKLPPGQQSNGQVPGEEAIFLSRTGGVNHPKSGKVMAPKALGGPEMTAAPLEDPRVKLADWLTHPDNPFFAKALVNRYWAHFLNRGIAEPVDDMRVSNPPTNPELLEALATDFVRSGHDLKHLVKTITTSQLYGLSSVPNETNARDRQSFARFYPKRLSAEVLLDAIAQVTNAPTTFGGLPVGTRAIELPDESVASSFLDAFGRPKRDTACECERVTDATLGQSLLLLNSNEVHQKLTAAGARAEKLAKDPGPDADKIDDLFWMAFARRPSNTEKSAALHHIESRPDRKKEAFEDILWALINAKEFQFND